MEIKTTFIINGQECQDTVTQITESKLIFKSGAAVTATNSICSQIISTMASQSLSERQLSMLFKNFVKFCDNFESQYTASLNGTLQQADSDSGSVDPVRACESFQDFFKEFDGFQPSLRMLNTFAFIANASQEDARQYVISYFELSGNPNAESVAEKTLSQEFKLLTESFSKLTPSKQINTRFSVLYGPQGTGKSTKLEELTGGSIICCNSSMLPSDIMEDFDFVDGRSTFKPSAFQRAMVEGKKIGLDEINLLPFETLRFLQSILDGKKQIIWKGKALEIADGFEAIGTMNLQIGSQTYGLPEPLVDRASVIAKYELTPQQLAIALR